MPRSGRVLIQGFRDGARQYTWDTAVVWPEYQTGQGRVDFALKALGLTPTARSQAIYPQDKLFIIKGEL